MKDRRSLSLMDGAGSVMFQKGSRWPFRTLDLASCSALPDWRRACLAIATGHRDSAAHQPSTSSTKPHPTSPQLTSYERGARSLLWLVSASYTTAPVTPSFVCCYRESAATSQFILPFYALSRFRAHHNWTNGRCFLSPASSIRSLQFSTVIPISTTGFDRRRLWM